MSIREERVQTASCILLLDDSLFKDSRQDRWGRRRRRGEKIIVQPTKVDEESM